MVLCFNKFPLARLRPKYKSVQLQQVMGQALNRQARTFSLKSSPSLDESLIFTTSSIAQQADFANMYDIDLQQQDLMTPQNNCYLNCKSIMVWRIAQLPLTREIMSSNPIGGYYQNRQFNISVHIFLYKFYKCNISYVIKSDAKKIRQLHISKI